MPNAIFTQITKLLLLSLILAVNAAPQEPVPSQTSPEPASSSVKITVSEVEEPVFNSKIRLLEAGLQHKNTLVLVHGLGNTGADDWQQVIPHLAQSYRVIAFDLPGFGQSTASSGLYSPENYAKVVAHLVSHKTHAPVTVIGHSLGSAISLKFAANYPQQVKKLILISPAGLLQKTVFAKHLTRLNGLSSETLGLPVKLGILDRIGQKLNQTSEWLLENADRLPDPTSIIINNPLVRDSLLGNNTNANAALALITSNFHQDTSQLTLPVHLIWGSGDEVAPRRISKMLQARLPNSQLHIIENGGHVPMKNTPFQLLHLLDKTLAQPPKLKSIDIPRLPNQDFHCQNQNEQVISGTFKTMILDNCRFIRLNNVKAEQIILKNNSRVSMETVIIDSEGVGLELDHSALEGTDVIIQANQGIQLNRAKLDLAAAIIESDSPMLRVEQRSFVYFSLSDRMGETSYPLHGAFVMEQQTKP